jgi:hypothetical protein
MEGQAEASAILLAIDCLRRNDRPVGSDFDGYSGSFGFREWRTERRSPSTLTRATQSGGGRGFVDA